VRRPSGARRGRATGPRPDRGQDNHKSEHRSRGLARGRTPEGHDRRVGAPRTKRNAKAYRASGSVAPWGPRGLTDISTGSMLPGGTSSTHWWAAPTQRRRRDSSSCRGTPHRPASSTARSARPPRTRQGSPRHKVDVSDGISAFSPPIAGATERAGICSRCGRPGATGRAGPNASTSKTSGDALAASRPTVSAQRHLEEFTWTPANTSR